MGNGRSTTAANGATENGASVNGARRAYIVGTCDTKGEELRYVCDLIQAAGVPTCLIDVGTRSSATDVDVTAAAVMQHHPAGASLAGLDDRGKAVTLMSEALAAFLKSRTDLGGVIGMGGSGNTTLVTQGMQALPIGVPKVMVSTMAAGNCAPYIGGSDIAMFYAVTDIAGLNSISRVVLGNAAHALTGMIARPIAAQKQAKPAIALTMYGVTTTCVTQIRQSLEADFDCLVFHATAEGRKAVQKLGDSRLIQGQIDITTTQLAIATPGMERRMPEYFTPAIEARLPFVGSVGAMDMVNFGPPESIPAHLKQRLFYRHNAFATLMRTNRDENAVIGRWLGEQLNRFASPLRFLLPEKGVSAIDAAGQPFFDPEANAALFDGIEKTFRATRLRQVIRLPFHINDAAFAAAVVEQFQALTAETSAKH